MEPYDACSPKHIPNPWQMIELYMSSTFGRSPKESGLVSAPLWQPTTP